MIADTIKFLNSIGITASIEVGANGFCEGVRIKAGTLLVDPSCQVSELLHEAGHLAIVPGRFRNLLDGNVSQGIRRMMKLTSHLVGNYDDPIAQAIMQCTDLEATAWAYAAGLHLEIPPEEIISDDHYEGEGVTVRATLQHGTYFGIDGLSAAGFCSVKAGLGTRPVYPKLAYWTQIH